MEIRFTLNARDMAAFQRHASAGHAIELNWWQSLIGIGLFIGVIVLAVVFVDKIWAWNIPQFLLHAIIIVGFLTVISLIWRSVFLRRMVRAIPGEVVVRFAEDGIHQDDAASLVVTRWEAIERIVQTKEHIFITFGYARGLIIPRRAFPDPAAEDATLDELRSRRPDLDPKPPKTVTIKAGKSKRWRRIAYLVLAVIALLVLTTPWRKTAELADGLGSVSYLVAETDGAGADARLPLIIEFHPLGGFPEAMRLTSYRRDFQARFVYPAGPYWHLIGLSWFSLDDEMSEEARLAADRIAAFTQALMERYPTAGRPIVTGFSQGGSMAFEMAAFHPELFAAAVPLAGALPDSLPERAEAPAIVVRALHGAEDEVVHTDWARYTIDEMQGQGWDADLTTYPDVGHGLPRAARGDWNRILADLAAAEAAGP